MTFKRFAFLTFLTILIMPFVAMNAAAKDVETSSTIKEATVYNNRATLTREATVQIEAGAHNVVIKGLPPQIFTDSLRVEGEARGQVILGALSHKRVNQAELSAPREKELNDQLQKLKDQRNVIQAEKTALNSKKDFLDDLAGQAKLRSDEEIAKLSLNTEEWAAASDSIYTQIAEILKAQLAHDVKTREIDKDIQRIQRELGQLRTGQKSVIDVSVPVEATAATSLKLSLSYQVPNASWTPLYDARLDTESEDLVLQQYGAVRQSTGEDWTDIKLTLSTAQPSRGASLPDLNPMWVNVWEQGKGGRGRANESARMLSAAPQVMNKAMVAEFGGMADAVEEESYATEAAVVRGAVINTGGFVSEYVIPGPSTVKADGTESKLLIGNFDLDSVLQVQVKPQLSSKAYLVSRATLKGEAPILPGQVNLFRDGAYVGQAYVPLLRAGEEQDLSFGIDDQVSVTRKTVLDEKTDPKLIKRDNEQEKHFVTEIKNLHKQAINLVVLETIPVGKNEKIEIEIVEDATTAGYEDDFEDIAGLLRWQKDLAAGETIKVNLGWVVTWPKDHSINGF